MTQQRLTWQKIKEKYPNQTVGLIDIQTGINSMDIISAAVLYTEKRDGLVKIATASIKGEVFMISTNIDSDLDVGVLTW